MRTMPLAICAMFVAAPALADCKSEVDAALDKLRQSSAFRIETKIVNGEGSLTMSVDFAPPDRIHQTVATAAAGGEVELIVIGAKAWSNQGQGWAELPENFAAQVSKQLRDTVVERRKGELAYECLGEVEFERARYLAYRANLPGVPTREAPASGEAVAPRNVQTVYVDNATGLPKRNVVTSKAAPDQRLFDGTFSEREGLKIEEPVAAR